MLCKSRRAYVVEIAQLLTMMNEHDIVKFKSILFKELGYKNEMDFIARMIFNLHLQQKLSSNTMVTLLDGASSIITRRDTSKNMIKVNQVNLIKNNHFISINFLSKLPSNTFAQIGSFLTKSDSLKFGLVNRQFYIETQKKSFLLLHSKENNEMMTCFGMVGQSKTQVDNNKQLFPYLPKFYNGQTFHLTDRLLDKISKKVYIHTHTIFFFNCVFSLLYIYTVLV